MTPPFYGFLPHLRLAARSFIRHLATAYRYTMLLRRCSAPAHGSTLFFHATVSPVVPNAVPAHCLPRGS